MRLNLQSKDLKNRKGAILLEQLLVCLISVILIFLVGRIIKVSLTLMERNNGITEYNNYQYATEYIAFEAKRAIKAYRAEDFIRGYYEWREGGSNVTQYLPFVLLLENGHDYFIDEEGFKKYTYVLYYIEHNGLWRVALNTNILREEISLSDFSGHNLLTGGIISQDVKYFPELDLLQLRFGSKISGMDKNFTLSKDIFMRNIKR